MVLQLVLIIRYSCANAYKCLEVGINFCSDIYYGFLSQYFLVIRKKALNITFCRVHTNVCLSVVKFILKLFEYLQVTVNICGKQKQFQGISRNNISRSESHIRIDGLYFCADAHFLSSFFRQSSCVCVSEWSSFQDPM